MDLTLQEKQKTIALLKFLLNEEISKPLGEMNSEAVDNYMKIIFLLQDKYINLSPEFIDEQVRKIFREEEKTASPEAVKTTKKYFNKKKAWLIAACIAVLVALFSVISFSSERSVKDILVEFFGAYEFIPIGEEVIDGNVSYGNNGKTTTYDSITDLVKAERIDLLFPTANLTDIKLISLCEKDKEKTISIAFENSDLYISITLNSEIPEKNIDICNKNTTYNNIEYYLSIMEDVDKAQAYFVYDNNFYTVIRKNEKPLMDALKNMEEIKYED